MIIIIIIIIIIGNIDSVLVSYVDSRFASFSKNRKRATLQELYKKCQLIPARIIKICEIMTKNNRLGESLCLVFGFHAECEPTASTPVGL